MTDFEEKVIVVTGASGNLGSAVVKAFLQRRGTVCGLDHGKNRLSKLFDGDNGPGNLLTFDEVDVTDLPGMQIVAEKILSQVRSVDVLVNTVGGFTMGERVHNLSSDTWGRMMDLNVHSLLNTTRVFVPQMMKQGHGKIISIGSKASLKGSAKTGAYAAAKSAVLRLTESMAAELQAENIQANCVLPSTIDTKENRQAMPDANFENWVTPMQVAEVIVFLSSPDSDGISGAAIPVYGKS